MSRKANGRGRALVLCAGLALLGTACSEDTPTVNDGAPPAAAASSAGDAEDKREREPERQARAGGCRVPRRAAPPDVKPHYEMAIEILPDEGAVTGTSLVTFAAERATQRLVFRLWPNGPRLSDAGAELTVSDARLVDGEATVARPDPTTLVLELGRRLPPGEAVQTRLEWRLELPGDAFDRISQNGTSIRLGSFFPILSWEGDLGWGTDPPTTSLAESSVSPTADFDVTVGTPKGLGVIATGEETSPGEWTATDVRDFAVATGDFETVRTVVEAPRRVRVTVGVAAGVDADPDRFARAIEQALLDLSERYGAYPWKTFSMAIMPDLGSAGIEYPSMIFQGKDSLENATTHEVAHSWFYALVGNNQARDPWLDEGVTSWAQARGDDILGYFRAFEMSDGARGRMGKPMRYWDAHENDYYAGVYVQGVKALDALGKPHRTDCALKRYVAANAYDVATTDDLLDSLEKVYPRAERVLERFGARR